MPPEEASAEESREGAFGSWRVLEVLGEGATGRVLLAGRAGLEDGRRVAIKTLRSPSAGALARFELERQALARLEHPSIARLYDAGTSGAGVPYVVLEHVDGEPIDLYCDRRQLPVEARLRLFLEVCGGVQHAHRNLIVHRDLKPDNILVDREGRPRLLDFGIARLLDQGPPAAAGSTTLAAEATARTPAYASPEQILGRPITTAADVFSLGIVLYELLTGRSPWRAASRSRHELERAICTEDAAPASRAFRRGKDSPASAAQPDGTEPNAAERARRRGGSPARLARRLRGELDAILRKALAREPEDRYASVEALARDLENHLAHLPIAARPPSVAETARLFLRRHLGAALAAAALLAAAGVFLLVLDGRARLLRSERDSAGRTLAFLVEVFRADAPGRSAAAGGGEPTARAILDRASGRVENELAGLPEVQADLLDGIGQVYFSLGFYRQAARQHQLALAGRRALGRDDDLDTATTRLHLGEALLMGGEPAAAEKHYRQSLELRRRAVERKDLPADSPDLVDSLIGLSTALEAQQESKETIALRREIVAKTGGQELDRRVVALGLLATALAKDRQFAEARRYNDQAFALALSAPGFSTLYLAEGLLDVAIAMRLDSDPRALPLLERSLAIRRPLLAEDHPRLLETEQGLAQALASQGRWREARELLDRVVAGKLRQLGPEHPMVFGAELQRARCIGELGDWDQAVALGEGVLGRAEAAAVPAKTLSGMHTALFDFERRRQRLGAAGDHLRRAREWLLAAQASRPDQLQLLLRQASLEADLGRLEEARRSCELLIGELRELPEEERSLALAEALYGKVLARLGREGEAEGLARSAYDRLGARDGVRSSSLTPALEALREVYRTRGDETALREVEIWLADPLARPARLAAGQ